MSIVDDAGSLIAEKLVVSMSLVNVRKHLNHRMCVITVIIVVNKIFKNPGPAISERASLASIDMRISSMSPGFFVAVYFLDCDSSIAQALGTIYNQKLHSGNNKNPNKNLVPFHPDEDNESFP